MSIRIRAILVIVLTNSLIIILGIVVGMSYLRASIEDYIEADLLVVADMADEFISSELELLENQAAFAAMQVATADKSDRQDTLEAMAQKYPKFIGMSIVSANAVIELGTGDLPNTANLQPMDAFKEAIGGTAAFTSTVETENGIRIYLTCPIPDDEQHILVLTLSGTYFSDLVSGYYVWETGHVFIDDKDGYIIANIRSDWVEGRQNFVLEAKLDPQYSDIADVVSQVISGQRGTGYYSVDGEPRACAFTPISGSDEGWCLGIVAPLSESPIRNFEIGMVIVAVIVIMLNVIAAIIASIFIKKPFDQVEELKEIAEANTKAKSRFLAHMSHEIRTPLNAVVGLSELSLDNEKLDQDTQSNMEKVHASGLTILSIVNDILDISKIESGKMELYPCRYDTPSMINDAVTLNLVRIGEKSISFKLEVDEALPIALEGDDLRVKQIFNNLLSNAFKYTETGEVTWKIGFERDGESVWLLSEITDTGIGIKESDQKKLFSDYNQVDTKANRKVEGTGLGLVITKQLLELMDGEIKVRSEYGKGTTVKVRLRQAFIDDRPIGRTVAANLMGLRYKLSKHKENAQRIRMDLSYARVLVVDDIETNIDVAKGMLKPYKLHVDAAISGKQAIEMVRAERSRYNAIFMDHMMPGMDGIEATHIIREQIDSDYARTVPIIALTANAIIGNEEMFLSNGFQDFLSKPIDMLRLDAVLKHWVRDKSMEKDATATNDIGTNGSGANMNEQKKPKIMLVDDNQTSLSLGKGILKDHYEVYALPSAERLFKFLEAVQPSLILLDVEMPNMNGFEVIVALKSDERYADIPVVFVTSNIDDEKRSKGEALGAEDFIKKPFAAQELLECVGRIIG